MNGKWKLIPTVWLLLAAQVLADFSAKQTSDRIEVRDGGKLVLGWQVKPLKDPKGGPKFALSAYIHPLATPSGFVMTDVQPDDHLHHLGVWWPWKHVTVGGKKYVTWEMQNGEGRHMAVDAKIVKQTDDEIIIEARNRTEIRRDGNHVHVTRELATLKLSRLGAAAYVLDIDIVDSPLDGQEVEIGKYRYSGFSWRGVPSWNATNMSMLASGGEDQSKANNKPADWILVNGPSTSGVATMLIMSGASKGDNTIEKLRIWDAAAHGGTPFINFNPVVDRSILLNKDNREVASRSYRLVVADHAITGKEAAKLWSDWK